MENSRPLDKREGLRYRIIYNDGSRKNKQLVITFMREENGRYVFDTSPMTGTIEIPVNDVIVMIETEMALQPWPMTVRTSMRR